MTAAELRELSPEELGKKEAELREELFKLRMRAATSQLGNPSRVRAVRRDIARVLTVRRQQDLAAARAPGGGKAA